MIPITADKIGGGRVERAFKMGDRMVRAGEVLSGDEVRSIRAANRSALIDKSFLRIWPVEAVAQAAPQEDVERFVRPLAFGRGYDVIEGRKVNEVPLTKEQAHELAGIPLPGADKAQN